SLNFRFKNNLSVLDNRGMRDLDRIVEYLQETLGKKIILSGFADNSGDYEHNRILALERAETVAQELRSRGIPISTVISAGEELPVAANATDLGREKNRRVEVWIK
ncbi:MAG: OmpA family protein, partial [Desulfoprunum sp.]|nr:OmpA family protein [Desulfoprunum sp.]